VIFDEKGMCSEGHMFGWMYYRDLPLLGLVDTLPPSHYEIVPGYVSIAAFPSRDRDASRTDIPCAGQ
jgi:hypothetical protein